MPIEIKELTVRFVIKDDLNKKISQNNSKAEFSEKTKKEIIQECVEKVLEKLDKQKER
jgi:hypothetical protein